MPYDLFIKRRVDEIEESLLEYEDPIERLHVWYTFIKDFTMEAHSLLDAQYGEMVQWCKIYAGTPDLAARRALRKQITSCGHEIENLNSQLKRIPKIQARLEKDVIGSTDTDYDL